VYQFFKHKKTSYVSLKKASFINELINFPSSAALMFLIFLGPEVSSRVGLAKTEFVWRTFPLHSINVQVEGV